MSSADNLYPYCFELCPKTLGDCPATYGESIAFQSPAAYVREPEKVERFRLPFFPFRSVRFREPSELDESGFLVVNFQTVFGESFLHFFQKAFRLTLVLEPHNEVVGIAYDDYLTACFALSPSLYPLVKDVMQVDVAEQGRYDRPLRRAYLRL